MQSVRGLCTGGGSVIVFAGRILSGRDDCTIQICKQEETERQYADTLSASS